MLERDPSPLAEICARLESLRLPRWEELPDLELYMDQVLGLMRRYLGACPGFDEKGLTASMVNNYVKMGALPPPQKKRYTRVHLARLLVICILKASLPISAVERLCADALSRASEEEFYNDFCGMFEQAGRAVAQSHGSAEGPEGETVCRAALRAQAEQSLAMTLFGAQFSKPKEGE